MPRSGKGTIHITFPKNLYIFVNNKNYTDNVLNYDFVEQENELGEFSVDLAAVSSTDKETIKRGSDVQLRYANKLIFKGIIERCDYQTDEFVKIKGYDATGTKLKNVLVKETASVDETSLDGRPSYGQDTVSGVSSRNIVDEQVSGVASVYIKENEYLGHLIIGSEFDTVFSFLNGVARTLSGVSWSSYGSYPFSTNFFNVAKTRAGGEIKKDFYTTGINQNANKTSREVDEEALWTSVTILGAGDGTSQLQSRCYHATDNFTYLTSGCSAETDTMHVKSTTGFPDSYDANLVFENWETGSFQSNWEISYGGAVTIQDTIVKNGNYALKFSNTPGNERIYSPIPVSAEGIYGCWSRTENAEEYSYVQIFSGEPIQFPNPSIQLGVIDDQFYYEIQPGGIASKFGVAVDGTWYKFVIEYIANSFSANFKVYDAAESLIASVSNISLVNPFSPTYIQLYRDKMVTTPIVYFDDIIIGTGGIWVGSEVIAYTSKTATTFNNCNRANASGFLGGQKYNKKYAHSAGVVVMDGGYNEYSTDGNSKIDTYGLKQKAIVDKQYDSQDSADLAALNTLTEHYEPTERITLEPSDMWDCLEELNVSDIVSVTDADAGTAGNYRIVSQRIKNSEGLETLEYDLSNIKPNLMRDLSIIKKQLEFESRTSQGSASIINVNKVGAATDTIPLELNVFLSNNISRIEKATLNAKIYTPTTEAERTMAVAIGPLSGVMGTVATGVVSGVSTDITNWINSGAVIEEAFGGAWMLVRMTPNDACDIDASANITVYVRKTT